MYTQITVERIERAGPRGGKVALWVGKLDGQLACEARTKREAIKLVNRISDEAWRASRA